MPIMTTGVHHSIVLGAIRYYILLLHR